MFISIDSCVCHHFSIFLSVDCLLDTKWTREKCDYLLRINGCTAIDDNCNEEIWTNVWAKHRSSREMIYTFFHYFHFIKWFRWIEMNSLSHSTWIMKNYEIRILIHFNCTSYAYFSEIEDLSMVFCSCVHLLFWPLFFFHVCLTSDLFGTRSHFYMC